MHTMKSYCSVRFWQRLSSLWALQNAGWPTNSTVLALCLSAWGICCASTPVRSTGQMWCLPDLHMQVWHIIITILCISEYCICRRVSVQSVFVSVGLDCGWYSVAVTCVIQCFPPWLRFAQCLRCFWDTGHMLHLLNAGKYFTVFLMVTLAGLYNMARGTQLN